MANTAYDDRIDHTENNANINTIWSRFVAVPHLPLPTTSITELMNLVACRSNYDYY
jgi:hypothetical protein